MGTPDEPIYFEQIPEGECRALLPDCGVGRVAWWDSVEVHVVPVNYRMVDECVVFHTASNTVLAAMVEPTPVTFQVDDFDEETATGWSVLARGMTEESAEKESVAWRPEASVAICIRLSSMTGRVISGATTA